MARADALQRIIGEIYDAAGSPDGWAVCLQSIRNLFGATAAHLIHHDHRSHDGGISAAAGLDPAAIHAYLAHYHQVDPWLLHMTVDSLRPGAVILGESLVAHREMLRTEYYAGLGKPYDLTRCLGATLLQPSATASANLSINRSDHAPEFTMRDVRLMQILVPHLQRALALHRRLTHIDSLRSAAANVIDRMDQGVILVDVGLQAVLANRAANQLLAERDGLFLERAGPKASSVAQTTMLRRLVANAAAVTTGMTVTLSEGVMSIPRRAPRPPLQILVTPISAGNQYAGVEGLAVAAIFITDPNRSRQPDQRLLQALYGFTRAEARVAAVVAEGLPIDTIAQRLGLTLGTARWYIKQLREKTGTSTHAQLTRVLVGGLAGIK